MGAPAIPLHLTKAQMKKLTITLIPSSPGREDHAIATINGKPVKQKQPTRKK